MRRILPVLFHLLPLLPLWQGRTFGVIAALLLVALPYIKVKKLGLDVVHAEAQRTGLHDARLEREIEGLKTALGRWRALTFLDWRRSP